MSRDFLLQLIQSYEGAMQGVIGSYLEQSMKLFTSQQQIRERVRGVVGADLVGTPYLWNGTLPECCAGISRSGRLLDVQPVRNRAIRGDAVWNGKRQGKFDEIDLAGAEERVALVDQVQQRSDDQGNET